MSTKLLRWVGHRREVKKLQFRVLTPTPTPPPHVSLPAWKVQRLLRSCSLHVKKKMMKLQPYLSSLYQPKSNEKIIYTLWQHFTIRINDERTNPSRTLDRPLRWHNDYISCQVYFKADRFHFPKQRTFPNLGQGGLKFVFIFSLEMLRSVRNYAQPTA